MNSSARAWHSQQGPLGKTSEKNTASANQLEQNLLLPPPAPSSTALSFPSRKAQPPVWGIYPVPGGLLGRANAWQVCAGVRLPLPQGASLRGAEEDHWAVLCMDTILLHTGMLPPVKCGPINVGLWPTPLTVYSPLAGASKNGKKNREFPSQHKSL